MTSFPSRGAARTLAFSLLACANLALLSCCDCPPPSPKARAASWLDVPDLGQLAPQELLRRRPVLDLAFRQPSDVETLTLEPAPLAVVEHEQGLELEFEARIWVSLTLPVDLPAREVDALEVVARGLRGRATQLSWRSADGSIGSLPGFSPERLRQGLERYRFTVHGRHGWQGRIRQLTWRFPLPTSTFVLHQISAFGEEVDPERAAPWRTGSVQVDLDGDVRASRLLVPGETLGLRFRPSDEAELQAAIGVPAWSAPARFQLGLVGEREPLAEWRIGAADGWRDLKLRLDELLRPRLEAEGRCFDTFVAKGVELELRLQADTDETSRVAGFWAHPAIFDRHDRLETYDQGQTTAPEQPWNVILISVDTLRADHLSLYGYQRRTSPHLDRWAADHALVFEDVVAPSPWTLPSHASMLTGLDAHRHGVNQGSEEVPPNLQLLAETLREAGYATQAFTGGGYLHPRYGLAQGFDGFRYWRDRRAGQAGDELLANVELSVRWLEQHRDHPFFLFLHTYEVHGPLRTRQPYYREFGGRASSHQLELEDPGRQEDEGFVRWARLRWQTLESNAAASSGAEGDEPAADTEVLAAGEIVSPEVVSRFYDSGIAYLDRQLDWLFTTLDQLDLTDRTIVVLTSDHGELLGEHGFYNHYYLYDENLQVPLVLAVPDREWAGKRVDAQVRTVDIVPTLLELLGLPPSEGIDGVSLVDLANGEGSPPPPAWSYAASSNYGIALQSSEAKVILHTNAWPGGEELGREDLENQGSEAARRLLRQARRSFVREVTGTRLRIQNPRASDWLGRFRGSPDPLFTSNLKTIDLNCPPLPEAVAPTEEVSPSAAGSAAAGPAEDVEPEELEPQGLMPEPKCLRLDESIQSAHFRVPAGETFTFFFESETVFVRFHVERDDGLIKPTSLFLDDRTAFQAARFDGKNFLPLDRPLLPDETGIMLWWDGLPALVDTTAPTQVPIPPDLREQLRALGYLR